MSACSTAWHPPAAFTSHQPRGLPCHPLRTLPLPALPVMTFRYAWQSVCPQRATPPAWIRSVAACCQRPAVRCRRRRQSARRAGGNHHGPAVLVHLNLHHPQLPYRPPLLRPLQDAVFVSRAETGVHCPPPPASSAADTWVTAVRTSALNQSWPIFRSHGLHRNSIRILLLRNALTVFWQYILTCIFFYIKSVCTYVPM